MTLDNIATEIKSDKKEKKRKREDMEKYATTSKDELKKEERVQRKEKKKAEKEELLSKVPKVDENGIAYTKVQIKRMMKRVKRGLSPVPTEEEERERVRRLKEEERETQEELSGMMYTREDEDSEAEDDGMVQTDENRDNDDEENSIQEKANQNQGVDKSDTEPPRKKKARSKPVPYDYVCYACKNRHSPLHWIYDCPDKIHNPGSNHVKKKIKGINEPSERKVFVSGLPFDIKAKDVEEYFEKEKKCGKVVHCKLLLFPDTKRCKGTGFVTFESDEGARNALKLNGTSFDIIEDKSSNGKQTKKLSLTLSVKKVLSRSVTKKLS